MKSESPNLHRHQKKQKNQTTRCTKPAQAPKKQRKIKFPGTMGPLLSSCWIFCFFCFFGACRCFVKSESPNLHRHQKKQKKQTTRCTKPAQAPKKPKKLKFQELWVHFWVVAGIFVFFGACRCLVHLVVWFFCFFWCLSMLCEVRVTKPAQAPKTPKKPNH